MVTKKKVSIITVNFNQPEITEAMLASIYRYNDYSLLEIIVVDNGSKYDPIPAWRIKYPQVVFIRSEVNTGFAGGNNIGIQQATGDYFFLVNNDTELTAGLITALANDLDRFKEVGMVSPKIRYFQQPDTLQYAGYSPMNFFTARNTCLGQFEKDAGQYDGHTGETGYGHGAAMMVRREAIEKAGLMKENYFLYFEELDWCEAIKRAGYTIWLNMQALIYHKESVSVGKRSALKEYFMNRNRILFIRRNASRFQMLIFWIYFLLVVVPRNLWVYYRNRDKGFSRVLLKAIFWNLTQKKDSTVLGFALPSGK